MATTKKEFSAIDAAPHALYAKLDGDRDNPFTFPLVCDVDGKLLVSTSSGTGGTTTITGSVVVINVVSVTFGTVTITGSTAVVGTVTTRIITSATATLSNITSTTVSTTLLTSNTARIGGTIYNDSTAILYLKFGTTASTTSFTAKLLAEDYYELSPPIFTGHITGIWAATNGAARATELT